MLAQVVERNELIWFGRPPDESQLGDHDAELAAQVRERQAEAYDESHVRFAGYEKACRCVYSCID